MGDYVDSFNPTATRGRLEESCENGDRGGLPGPVRAKETEDFTAADAKTDSVNCNCGRDPCLRRRVHHPQIVNLNDSLPTFLGDSRDRGRRNHGLSGLAPMYILTDRPKSWSRDRILSLSRSRTDGRLPSGSTFVPPGRQTLAPGRSPSRTQNDGSPEPFVTAECQVRPCPSGGRSCLAPQGTGSGQILQTTPAPSEGPLGALHTLR